MRALFQLILLAAGAGAAHAQLSLSAYRALGQMDLRQNSLNMVQGVELNQPSGIALDLRGGPVHIYISDTRNSRVLAWADLASYQTGDVPAIVLGQPGLQYSNALGIGTKGFASPAGLAVDPTNGNLYVADFGNNRVLRFPSPFDNPSRIEPDAVYGQPNFTTRTTVAASSSSLNQPRALAFDSAGNLWVADAGNNRVVRFNAAVLNNPTPPAADMAVGQKDLFGGGANSGAGAASLNTPAALVFDGQNNLYVSDFRNARVLRFPAPLDPTLPNPAANAVWGQNNFTVTSASAQPSASSLAGPIGLAVDNSGNLYVAVPNDNRVLVFPLTPPIGGAAKNVLGQANFTTVTTNTGAFPLASANSLSTPSDVKVDGNGNIIVADTGNNRVLEFPANAKSALRVWGQSDFASNGPNQIKPGSINFPFKIAVDYSSAPFALYVSDTGNNRVLIWKDSAHFHSGDPADLVIGQPNLRTGAANVDSQGASKPTPTSLAAPTGLAVNPVDGTLYVADAGNNRVLRYPRPVSQSGRITPDAVIGQSDFTSSVSAAVTAGSLNNPGGVAIGPNGDLFVSDSGNNRVLEFAAAPGTGSSAIRVFGQPNMNTSFRSSQVSAQTFSAPQGIAVDQASNLFVADTGANRVLIFPNTQNAAPAGSAATFVLGEANFSSTTGGMKAPVDVGVDSNGTIYVSDNGNNRILVFPSLIFLPAAGGSATAAIGQSTTGGTNPNWNSTDGLATAEGLYAPVGLYVDRQDTLYVGDSGNNRVLQFPKAAVTVNAATFQASVPVGQGALATAFGAALANDKASVSLTTWPTTLLNRQLLFNDSIPAPLYYLDQGQANFQVPTNAPLGTDRVAVRVADTGELVAGGTVLVAAASPGLFTSNQAGTGQAAVVNQDGTINGPANPAPAGSTILIYGTGQGQVSPAVADGTAAPSSPLAQTVAVPTSDGKTCLNNQPSMCVAVGNTFGTVKYSGLAPGYIGLWQINVTLPQGITGTAVPVRVVVNGTPSNGVTVAIR